MPMNKPAGGHGDDAAVPAAHAVPVQATTDDPAASEQRWAARMAAGREALLELGPRPPQAVMDEVRALLHGPTTAPVTG
ncbi:hypothetical protein SUDANB95_07979 (plasmid) [Actinosynnema sp. ALI-1.44]